MIEPILYIGISQFLFAALLIFTKPKRHLGDTTMGLWLLLMCIFMALALARAQNPDSFWSRLQLFPFFFTIGPFLLLYVRFLTGGKKHFVFEDGLHILPFAVFSAIAVTQSHRVDDDVLNGNLFTTRMIVYNVFGLASFVYYLVTTFVVIRRHQKKIKDYFSYTSIRINLRWVQSATFILSLTLVLTLLSVPVNSFMGAGTLNPGIPLFLGLTLFGYGVAFFGVRQPEIFSDPPPDRVNQPNASVAGAADANNATASSPTSSAPAKTTTSQAEASMPTESGVVATEEVAEEEQEEKKKKYSRSGLRQRKAEGYLDKLRSYLEEEQPYLRRDLTIQDIALALEIPQHHLTQTINELLEKNFYTLINEYRVEEVKKRLLDPKYNHLTVLAIAHDAGFNSKSSFNMTFKKYVGLTPSQYRKKHLG